MATRALLYRRPAEPSTLVVTHGSQFFSIKLRRHRRARRYTLRIHPTDRAAILTMPPRGTIAEAREFAKVHGGWIAARLGRLPKAAPFQPGTVLPLRGVPHRIVHRAGARGTVWTETRDSGEKVLCVTGDPDFTDRRVHDFLKREARKELQKASQAYAGELGVRHLAALGHRRIGLISGPARYLPVQRKLAGYRQTMIELLGGVDDELIELSPEPSWRRVAYHPQRSEID